MRKNTKYLFFFLFFFLLVFLAACNTEVASVTDAEINSDDELVLTLSNGETINVGKVVGQDGATGPAGAVGPQGLKGTDGLGIKSITINEQGELVIVYTDDESDNLGVVKGAKGDNGADGAKGDKGDK